MPGSVYQKIGNHKEEWLKVVKECQINTSTKSSSDKLTQVKLDEDEEMISFNVFSLCINVHVMEAIESSELLYSGKYKPPPVDKETFIKLSQIIIIKLYMRL